MGDAEAEKLRDRLDDAEGSGAVCATAGSEAAGNRSARIRAAAAISTSLLAAPFETDRKDESEIGVGNGGWRWRQWRGTCEQGKRLGIEYRRAGTLDDLTVQHVTLPIDTKVEINDARRALGLPRIALEAR